MIFKKILGIAACDSNGVMGKNGKLPWHYPEDLKHFADITLGSSLIMGYRTFLSLPTRYFEGRETIVFSHRKFSPDKTPNIIFVSSLSEFLAVGGIFRDLYVIGGAQIYTLFLEQNLIEEFILTRLKKSYEGDTFFPLPLLNRWSEFKIRETDSFTIHRYFNPSRSMHVHKNL